MSELSIGAGFKLHVLSLCNSIVCIPNGSLTVSHLGFCLAFSLFSVFRWGLLAESGIMPLPNLVLNTILPGHRMLKC